MPRCARREPPRCERRRRTDHDSASRRDGALREGIRGHHARDRVRRRPYFSRPEMTMRTSLTILAGIIAIQACGGAGDSAAGDTTPAESAAARADSAPTPGATAPVRNAAGRELGTLTL